MWLAHDIIQCFCVYIVNLIIKTFICHNKAALPCKHVVNKLTVPISAYNILCVCSKINVNAYEHRTLHERTFWHEVI